MLNWLNCIKLLTKGDYKNGWPDHDFIPSGNGENKFLNEFKQTPTFGKKVWDGKKTDSILINCDFGDGDTIQYFRFFKLLLNKANKVFIRCDLEFKDIFEQFGFIVIGKDNNLPNRFEIIHPMAIPKILGIGNIDGNPYLNPVKIEKHERLKNLLKSWRHYPKIGFCWSANTFNPDGKYRSLDVKKFVDLCNNVPWSSLDNGVPNFNFLPFSLQRQYEPPVRFFDLRGYMNNWNETANLIEMMDLIITVDTSVVHMAGALGIKTWLLVPFNMDWKWKSDKIWYNSVKIYKQEQDGDWDLVFVKLLEDLKELMNGKQ